MSGGAKWRNMSGGQNGGNMSGGQNGGNMCGGLNKHESYSSQVACFLEKRAQGVGHRSLEVGEEGVELQNQASVGEEVEGVGQVLLTWKGGWEEAAGPLQEQMMMRRKYCLTE